MVFGLRDIELLPDNAELAFGTQRNHRFYGDGTDLFLDLRADGGSGDLMIALGASFPSPDPEAVHIWRGDAGAVTARATAMLVLENNAGVDLQILVPDDQAGGIVFGSPSSNIRGGIRFNGTTDSPADTMIFIAASGERLHLDSAVFDLRTAGLDLDINAGFIQLSEMTAPGAGAANHVRIYAEADGGALTDLSAVFQDGTIVDFAEEV